MPQEYYEEYEITTQQGILIMDWKDHEEIDEITVDIMDALYQRPHFDGRTMVVHISNKIKRTSNKSDFVFLDICEKDETHYDTLELPNYVEV